MNQDFLNNNQSQDNPNNNFNSQNQGVIDNGITGNPPQNIVDNGMNGNQAQNFMNSGTNMNQPQDFMNNGSNMNQPQDFMNNGTDMNQPQNFMNNGMNGNQPQNFMNNGANMNQPQNFMNNEKNMNQPQNFMNNGMNGNQPQNFMNNGMNTNQPQNFMNNGMNGNQPQNFMNNGMNMNQPQNFMNNGMNGNQQQNFMNNGMNGNQQQNFMNNGMNGNQSQNFMNNGMSMNQPQNFVNNGMDGNQAQNFVNNEMNMNQPQNFMQNEMNELQVSTGNGIVADMPQSSSSKEIQLLKSDNQVIQLAQKIDYNNHLAILEYGKEPATQISNFSSRILDTIKGSTLEESSVLILQLNKIMDKFDKDDFVDKKGFLQKLFNKNLEKIFAKYNTMGSEIDKIYVEITKYEHQMKENTSMLEQMFDQNVTYYNELSKYIAAGELCVERMKIEVLQDLETKASAGDQMAEIELTTVRNAIEMIEQRCYDLEMARQISFQTAPQIRMLQKGNTNLIAKINSAFVVTIPIFKQGIINAVAAKRQKLVADSMAELDKRTNEMLITNAQNISKQSAEIARLSGSPSIKVETIEETWNIILRGVEETRNIEEENKRNRLDGLKRLEDYKLKIDQLNINVSSR